MTDSLSIHSIRTLRSADSSGPVSPGPVQNSLAMSPHTPRETPGPDAQASPVAIHRRRTPRDTPSIYTLKTNDSQSSLLFPSSYRQNGIDDGLDRLRNTGVVDGMFPEAPLLQNLSRYMRFSSASYGHHFLKTMGISKYIPIRIDDMNQEVHTFAHHTGLQPQDILLTSFIDTNGGADSTGSTNTSVPLVHYIALDHEAKAVVLACRGTLGFEDVLADMACEYDDLLWLGTAYKVHKGIHASARRLLYGRDGRVLATLRDALEKHPEYGVVLCGHSLGGAVTALLGVLLAEPGLPGPSFVTSAQPHHRQLLYGSDADADAATETAAAPVCLPAGRRIHVFAYGPPGTMSASLRRRTRGLVTSVVHGNDLVPYLSLGLLHDFQSVALAFKSDNTGAAAEFWQRVWLAFRGKLATTWHNAPAASAQAQDAEWAFASLKTLRASMLSQKLLPPGEVLAVETSAVLRRDAFVRDGAGELLTVQDARRVVLKHIRDVDTRFREIRFGVSVLTDHNPARYEDVLNTLRQEMRAERRV